MGTKSPDHVDVEVGQRIRVLRNAAGLSQTALADGLGVTFQQIQKYEKGANRVGAGRLTRIAGLLGIRVGQLLGADEKIGTTRKGPRDAHSPLELLTIPGALQLLRAYGKLSDGKVRRSAITLIENIKARRR